MQAGVARLGSGGSPGWQAGPGGPYKVSES